MRSRRTLLQCPQISQQAECRRIDKPALPVIKVFLPQIFRSRKLPGQISKCKLLRHVHEAHWRCNDVVIDDDGNERLRHNY